MRCKKAKILLPSNSRKNVDFDLLIEQQNRIFWDDLICLKRLAEGDAEAWKMLNDHERRAIYMERRKRRRTRKIQAVLAEAQKMILNNSSIERDDHDKAFLCKGLRFAPTPNWSQSVENAEWLNVSTTCQKN